MPRCKPATTTFTNWKKSTKPNFPYSARESTKRSVKASKNTNKYSKNWNISFSRNLSAKKLQSDNLNNKPSSFNSSSSNHTLTMRLSSSIYRTSNISNFRSSSVHGSKNCAARKKSGKLSNKLIMNTETHSKRRISSLHRFKSIYEVHCKP